jgi:site-specific recombinase XerD
MTDKKLAQLIAQRKAKNRKVEHKQNDTFYTDFRAYLEAKNILKSSTIKYAKQIDTYKKWLKTYKDKTPETTDKKDVLDYLQYLQEDRNLTNQSRRSLLGILKHYYSFLYQKQDISSNPTLSIKLRGTKRTLLHKVLSIEELNEFMDLYYHSQVREAEKNRHYYQRNYLILSLYIYQGIKRNEIKSLELGDIDLQKATIHIQASHKTNARVLPLNASQIGIFYEYLQNSRSKFGKENDLLINQYPCDIKYSIHLKKLYPKFTDFKQIRASIITYWIQTEGLRKAQYKAGHRYISSTENYLHNVLESLQDDISKFHPL